MSVTPSIRLVAWADRPTRFVFVAVPDERGRYIRTDRSVVLVPCPYCKAIKGEPCKTRNGYHGITHAWRRNDARPIAKGLINEQQDDQIEPVDVPPPGYDDPIKPEPELKDVEVVVRRKARPGEIVLLDTPRAVL